MRSSNTGALRSYRLKRPISRGSSLSAACERFADSCSSGDLEQDKKWSRCERVGCAGMVPLYDVLYNRSMAGVPQLMEDIGLRPKLQGLLTVHYIVTSTLKYSSHILWSLYREFTMYVCIPFRTKEGEGAQSHSGVQKGATCSN